MGGAGDLPGAQRVGVVLPRGVEAEDTEQVGLCDEVQHRHVEVVADAGHALAQHEPLLTERCAARAPAVDQEPVVDPGDGMERRPRR